MNSQRTVREVFSLEALGRFARQVLKRFVAVSFLLSLWLIAQAARGQTLYWDLPGGTHPNPNGAWNTATANWSPNSVGGSQAPWVNGSNAVFSASGLGATGSYTVTLSNNVTVGDLTYRGGNIGSTLQLVLSDVGVPAITMANPQMNVAVDAGTTLIVAPTIAGSGGNLVMQSGTLILSGTNTYTGGTTISGGTLQLGRGGPTGSIVGNVIDNAALVFDRSNTVTVGGAITGTGSLSKIHTGTLILTGTNTYTGGTTINVGTLQIGNGLLAGSIVGNVTDNAALVFDRSDGVTFGGTISGTGSLTQMGGSPLILTGTNTYTGGTTISTGTGLQIGNGAPSGSIIGNVIDDGFLTFERADDIAFDGNVSGTGILRQEGGGTLTLTGLNSQTGGTAMLGGTLSVDKDSELGAIGSGLILQGGELLTTTDGFQTARAVDVSQGKGNNTLAAATGTTAAYTGVFSDSGMLVVGDGSPMHAGTVVLSGNNTYTGGTMVLPGTLVAASNNALGTNPVELFAGTLEIPGGVTVPNAVNFVNGGTIINAGTLNNNVTDGAGAPQTVINSGIINGSVTLGAPQDTVQLFTGSKITGNLVLGAKPNSILILDGAGQQLLSLAVIGTLTNNGTLVKQGSGTWTIDRALDAPVGTDILAGTLAVDAVLTTPLVNITPGATLQLNAGGSVGNLVDDGSLIFASSGTVTFGTVISGPGNVIQDGTGTTILSGRNTYTGGTVIDLGTLLVDNAQALGIGDVIVNGGVLGADPQPINVKGNYTQNAGGTLQLQVAGANAGQYDTLNVGGNAALGGTLQLISLGFKPAAGNLLTLVTTGGAISSRFAQFVNPFATGPGFTTVDLIYGRNFVLLEFLNVSPPVPPVVVTTDFSSFAFTPNQSAAANLLDAVQLDPRAANLISFLNTEPFSNLPDDLQKISPDGLTAFYEISFSNANIQKLNLESRLDDIHNGSNGFSSNMKVNGATLNFEDRADADGKSSKAVVEPILQPGPENRWGVWVTGFGDFVNVDGDGNAQGYNFTTGGVSLGLDYRIADQLAIGVMGEYSHTWTDLNPGGHIDVDSGRGGVYATWFSHGIYINGAIYGGHNNYDSGRAGLGGLANGSTEGSEWSTFIGGGYDFHIAQLTVGPIASLQYTDVGIDSFDEKGSLAPLAIHSGSAESLRSDVGFRAFYQWQIGKLVVEPSLKAAWEHEYKYSALPITAGFAGIPGPSATFFGPSEGHDSAVVSAGVSVQVTPAITTYVNYDGQLGRGNYDSNAVTGGVRISF
jgi:fibronectin-binding autotransporter adhesin